MWRRKNSLAALSVLLVAVLISCVAQTHKADNANVQPANNANLQPADNANAQHGNAKSVRSIGTIHLPGNGGFTDYLIVAAQGHTLYAGYRTENKLVVVNTETNSVTASIGDLSRICSVALVPSLHLGFSSNRGEDKLGVIDLTSNRLLRKIPGGHGPDAIIYNEASNLVCAANHEGRSLTLVDPGTEKVVATIPLGGAAEYLQADPKTGLIYQNLEDTSEVVVVDTQKRAVVARYKIAPGSEPTGLALDAANHRLFCACGNEKLVVLDADNGKVIATLPIGSGVDFAAYDAALHRIYTANGGSGTMTVINQDTADQYRVIENVPTHRGGHALAVDPTTHRVYVTYGGSEILVYDAVQP
ncbi:MAG: hypothetical protein V7641_3841 [Blastocatellia bacterium]